MAYLERELEDDYPVYAGYWYVVDGEPKRSPINGKATDLKAHLTAAVITSCDIHGRNLPYMR